MVERKAIWSWLAALAAASWLAGCMDNDKSLVILYNVAPDDSCVYQIDPEFFISRGLLDLNHPVFGSPPEPVYFFSPQIHNYMPTNLSTCNCELDAMAIQLRLATISYRWLEGRDALGSLGLTDLLALEEGEFKIYLSGTVSAASTSGSPGQTLIAGLRLISPEVGSRLTAMGADARNFVLGVQVRIEGTTLGGTDIISNKFVYPIEFCWGCLNVSCPDGSYPACRAGQDSNNLECE